MINPVPRRVVFLLLPRVHVLDMAGPAKAFDSAAGPRTNWSFVPARLKRRALRFGHLQGRHGIAFGQYGASGRSGLNRLAARRASFCAAAPFGRLT